MHNSPIVKKNSETKFDLGLAAFLSLASPLSDAQVIVLLFPRYTLVPMYRANPARPLMLC